MELVQFIKRVVDYYDDCTLDFPSIVELKNESGLERQAETIHGMPYVLIEQRTMHEDSHYGYFYFPLKKRKYIRVPFFC